MKENYINIKINLNDLSYETKEKLLNELYSIEDEEEYCNESISNAIEILQEDLYGNPKYIVMFMNDQVVASFNNKDECENYIDEQIKNDTHLKKSQFKIYENKSY